MEDVMNMMEENKDGHMEFPRDVMLEDCFSELRDKGALLVLRTGFD